MSTFKLKSRNEVTIKLSQADLTELEHVDRNRVLYPKKHHITNPNLHEKVADAAIKKGLISPYEKTVRDDLIKVLEKMNDLESEQKRAVHTYAHDPDQLSYSEICKIVENQPSVLDTFNEMISDQGIYFVESYRGLIPHRRKDGKNLVDLSGCSDSQLSDMLSAAEKILEEHKE